MARDYLVTFIWEITVDGRDDNVFLFPLSIYAPLSEVSSCLFTSLLALSYIF